MSITEDITSISAPCFGCQNSYNCRYWQNFLWDEWILKTKECPVGKYPFNSLYIQLQISEDKKAKENSISKYRWDSFSKIPLLDSSKEGKDG